MGWRGRGRKQENLNVLCVPLRALLGETVPRHGWPVHTLPLLVAEPSYESHHFPHFAALVQVRDRVVFFFNKSIMNMEEC